MPIVLKPRAGLSAGSRGYYIRDTFTDTNGTSLASHTPEVGGAYTVNTGAATIQGNAAQLSTNTPDIVTIDATVADHTLTVDVNPSGINRLGIIFRFTSTSAFTFWELSGDSGTEIKIRHYDGAYNNIATAAYTWGAGSKQVKIVSSGATVTISIAGTQVFNESSVTQNQTATSVGFWGWEWGANATADNLAVVP